MGHEFLQAEYHMDAEAFMVMLSEKGVKCDLAIFDPPYSPRQISECYKEAGITVGMKETQNEHERRLSRLEGEHAVMSGACATREDFKHAAAIH